MNSVLRLIGAARLNLPSVAEMVSSRVLESAIVAIVSLVTVVASHAQTPTPSIAPTPTVTPCGTLAVFPIGACTGDNTTGCASNAVCAGNGVCGGTSTDDGLIAYADATYPPTAFGLTKLVCTQYDDTPSPPLLSCGGLSFDIKIIALNAYLPQDFPDPEAPLFPSAPEGGSYFLTYGQMQFNTNNGLMPLGATACHAELHLVTGDEIGNDDSLSLVGTYCPDTFPIVASNWTYAVASDALSVPISGIPSNAAISVPLSNVQNIAPYRKTDICVGVPGPGGGAPTGINGMTFYTYDNAVFPSPQDGPQLWVWYTDPLMCPCSQ